LRTLLPESSKPVRSSRFTWISRPQRADARRSGSTGVGRRARERGAIDSGISSTRAVHRRRHLRSQGRRPRPTGRTRRVASGRNAPSCSYSSRSSMRSLASGASRCSSRPPIAIRASSSSGSSSASRRGAHGGDRTISIPPTTVPARTLHIGRIDRGATPWSSRSPAARGTGAFPCWACAAGCRR
jgi:hypothetical protein